MSNLCPRIFLSNCQKSEMFENSNILVLVLDQTIRPKHNKLQNGYSNPCELKTELQNQPNSPKFLNFKLINWVCPRFDPTLFKILFPFLFAQLSKNIESKIKMLPFHNAGSLLKFRVDDGCT